METIAWRYKPEFMLSTLVNGQPVGDLVEIIPAVTTGQAANEEGIAGSFIARKEGGKLTVFSRQLRKGTAWEPAFGSTLQVAFTFWLKTKRNDIIQIPAASGLAFGSPVFYASNLSGTGEVDPGLSGNTFELVDPGMPAEKHQAALCTNTPSANITPGDYSIVKAAKVRAGVSIYYHFLETVLPTQKEAELDFRLFPGGTYMLKLEGSSPLVQRIVVDETALASGVQGIVDIYRDISRAPMTPLEYRMNFTT